MKKFYVIAIAALFAASAVAAPQTANTKKSDFKKQKATKVQLMKTTSDIKALDGGELRMATDAERAANRLAKAPKKAAPTDGAAYYKRPAGMFYANHSTANFWWSNIGAMLFGKAFAPVTFAANEAASYDWLVQLYQQDGEGNWAQEWLSASGVQNLTVQYQPELDSVPVLSVGDGNDYFNYSLKKNSTTSVIERMHTRLLTDPDPTYWFSEDEVDTYGYIAVSPKSFQGQRDDETSQYAMTSYTGAQADTINGVQSTGKWFGHNLSGWNAMTLYVEKPESAYGLRSVFVEYGNLVVNEGATADLYVKVYKVESRASHEDEGGEDIQFGDEIASAKVTVDETTDAEGYLQFTFNEYDEGAGDYIEVVPTIEDEIAIVVSGYDDPNIADFNMWIALDKWDEGYGQHGYINHVNEAGGKPTVSYGLNDFFTIELGYTAPTVFMDVINPYLVGNYTVETEGASRYFALDGTAIADSLVEIGFSEEQATEYASAVALYSSSPVEEAVITDENGEDLPDWLTVEITDDMEVDEETGTSEFSGSALAEITVEPLTSGTGRKCRVKINYPGAVYYIYVVQGDGGSDEPEPGVFGDVNGDGQVTAADVSAVYNIILGASTEYQDRADVNGDGQVTAADVSVLYNIILGAN